MLSPAAAFFDPLNGSKKGGIETLAEMPADGEVAPKPAIADWHLPDANPHL